MKQGRATLNTEGALVGRVADDIIGVRVEDKLRSGTHFKINLFFSKELR